MLGVHPSGHGSVAENAEELTVGLGPAMVDFGGIAAAAGGAWGARVSEVAEIGRVVGDGVRVVLDEGRCAVVDVVLEPFLCS